MAFSAWFGGRGAGILAIALGALASSYVFLTPSQSLALESLQVAARLGGFVLVAGLITTLIDRLHALQRQTALVQARVQAGAEELRRSRDQFDVILRGVTDGITAQEPSGHLIYANESAARLVGYPSPDALIAAPLSEVVGRFQVLDDLGQPLPLTELPGRLALRGLTPAPRVLRFRVQASGEERRSVVRATPVLDERGVVQFAINIFQDVTEQHRLEEKLRFLAEASDVLASSLEYETTLASVAQLAVPTLADWCVVDISDTAQQSQQPLAVAHADPAMIDLVRELLRRYPRDPNSDSLVTRVLRSGRSELLAEIPEALILAAARDETHLEILRTLGLSSVMVVPLVARGRTLGALTLAMANSGRRYGAEDLSLAEDVARRAAQAVDNARLYREVQTALHTRDEFLSSAAHDLKTPLTSIKGLAQLAQRRAARMQMAESDKIVETLDRIEFSATRMTRLINELLDVARLQMGQPLEIERRSTDLVALSSQTVAEHQALTERHQIQVESHAAHLIGAWDAARLERVLGNLLSNAIKYSPDGGEVLVSVGLDPSDERVALVVVRDHGVGIPPGDLPRIFERFHRAANVTGQIPGTGIGLAAAHHIVEQHGGTIEVQSNVGEGSTFTVRLPRDSPSHSVAGASQSPYDPCAG